MSETVDIAEQRANLKEYQDQLAQVEELLLDDPENEEYKGIYEGLLQVIELTKELLAEATNSQQEPAAARTTATALGDSITAPIAAITQAPEVKVPSSLPPQIADQIRAAQQRAALSGQGPSAWAIGAPVQARYSGDGMWYDAVVTAISVSGNFIVTFSSYGTQEEVQLPDIKLATPPMTLQKMTADGSEPTEYKGVDAPNRKKVTAGEVEDVVEIPKWLEVKPTDDEKTKLKKKKLIKSYKSKQRFQQMDQIQKEKADAWKSFVNKGTKRKKVSVKKESMFRVAEGVVEARVGVVGSGMGMTDYGKKKRHDFGGSTL